MLMKIVGNKEKSPRPPQEEMTKIFGNFPFAILGGVESGSHLTLLTAFYECFCGNMVMEIHFTISIKCGATGTSSVQRHDVSEREEKS